MNKKEKIYCIGIGGIGLSALARYFKHEGHEVFGSDSQDSALIQTLIGEGIPVDIGHKKENMRSGITLVVYTIAADATNIDLSTARENNILCKSYPEALGEVTAKKKTIAVCGTHGKTTTTAMAYYALKEAGISPTVIVGSLIGGVGSNFIHGDSEYLIVESCEYRRSFLSLHPTYMLLTNIDNDHLDYYRDRSDIVSAFQSFADKVSDDGKVLVHREEWDDIVSEKKVLVDRSDKSDIALSVPGDHNRSNAELVIKLGEELGLSEEKIRKGLALFPGTWRRMEYKGDAENITWYDDYGHHPTEIKATLSALREKYKKNEKKLFVIFQPHLFSRTKLLLDDFATAFSDADEVLLLPIYAARESFDASINSEMLQSKIGEKAKVFASREEVFSYCKEKASGSVVLTLGAGDVYLLHKLHTN